MVGVRQVELKVSGCCERCGFGWDPEVCRNLRGSGNEQTNPSGLPKGGDDGTAQKCSE